MNGATGDPNLTGDPDVDSSLELVLATFPDEGAASAAYDQIREAEKQELLLLVDAAVVNRDQANHLHIKEERDLPGGPGALWGAGIGAILGFIGGPLGLVIGGAAGALVGGTAASLSDAGISNERLAQFADTLKPGASTVIVVVAHYWSATATTLLTNAGGEVTTQPLGDDLARQLYRN